MGQSFFHFRQFSIFSQSKGLKVTTDACLLGAMASHPSPSKCLDIGTGTGVLSLMLAQKFPQADVIALEMDEEVHAEAALNISLSDFSSRIQLLHADFTLWDHEPVFDLIVCNPPYFLDHLQGSSQQKNMAMHNNSLPFDILAKGIASCLAPKGRCWMICPDPSVSVLINECKSNGLHLMKSVEVFNKPGKYFRTICCFSAEQALHPDRATFLLFDEHGVKTEAFKTLMTDFYLENTEFYKRKSKG